jgi:hypothetical protein
MYDCNMNVPAELKQALDAADGSPIEIVDGQRHYVVIQAELYERLKRALDLGESTEEERKYLLQQWGKSSGWEDPGDAVFDSLEPQ